MEQREGPQLGPRLVRDLVDVASTISSAAEAETKLERLCAAVVTTLGCDRSSIFLAEDGRYRARFNHGNPSDIAERFPLHRVPFDDPLVSLAVARRSFVVVNDVLTDPLMNHAVALLARIQAIVVVPLFDSGRSPVGFMTAEFNERPGKFDDLSGSLVLGLAKLGETVLDAERNAATQLELRRELEIANRLDAVSRLAAGVAHDLNNQLLAIIGFATAAQRRSPGPEIDRLIEVAESSGQLVQRILRIGAEPDASIRLDVSAVVEILGDRLRRAVPEHVLRFEIEQGLHVRCSFTDVDQILTNLVLNAGTAGPPGSEITVRLAGPVASDDGASYATLSVTDDGAGVDPEDVERIFSPFFSTKPDGSGTGLGLASVQSIVAALGGEVGVDNEPGRGATFTVRIPLFGRPDDADGDS